MAVKKKFLKAAARAKHGFTHWGWAAWIFPAFALILAGWLVYGYYAQRGPLITLHFEDAASVEAQKTPLRYRGIIVGKVDSVILSKNTKEVVVTVRLNRDAGKLAVEGSKFWVVEPQVDFAGVRGLETLFKGPYIRVEPGKGKPKLDFQGDTGDEIKDPTSGTVAYHLLTSMADSLGPGDPVTFRGLKIGSVTEVKLGPGAKEIDIQINVDREFVRLIRKNTVFWRKVGVQAKMGLFGADIKVNSIESLMKGGIALATPDEPEGIANAGSRFSLDDKAPKKWQDWSPKL
jgi:paraquat-inducible protein B